MNCQCPVNCFIRNDNIFKKITLNIKMFGVPPEHTANGNVHTDILLLGIIPLEHVMQNNFRWV